MLPLEEKGSHERALDYTTYLLNIVRQLVWFTKTNNDIANRVVLPANYSDCRSGWSHSPRLPSRPPRGTTSDPCLSRQW